MTVYDIGSLLLYVDPWLRLLQVMISDHHGSDVGFIVVTWPDFSVGEILARAGKMDDVRVRNVGSLTHLKSAGVEDFCMRMVQLERSSRVEPLVPRVDDIRTSLRSVGSIT